MHEEVDSSINDDILNLEKDGFMALGPVVPFDMKARQYAAIR